VHRVPADVKVVQKINYCAHGQDTGLVGCSWRPDNNLPRTMIVTTEMLGANAEHVLWAHEFGHVTGLLHRNDDRDALMWWCGLGVINRFINKDECHHFIAGPLKHYGLGVGPGCPPGQ
jgi:hypothetical protein